MLTVGGNGNSWDLCDGQVADQRVLVYKRSGEGPFTGCDAVDVLLSIAGEETT
jgi:hypothetical protein